MAQPTIYGADYSTYVRSVRLALEEKGAAYKLEKVDILSGQSQRPEYLARHPFGKIPAFEHDGFRLFESSAILRYIDDVFSGPPLQPQDPRRRARMNQIMSLLDSYGYPSLIGTIFIQRAIVPKMGGEPDEEALAAAVPTARKTIEVIEGILGDQPFLTGESISLADLQLVPVYHYALRTPEGDAILRAAHGLQRWWAGVSTRRSVAETKPSVG